MKLKITLSHNKTTAVGRRRKVKRPQPQIPSLFDFSSERTTSDESARVIEISPTLLKLSGNYKR